MDNFLRRGEDVFILFEFSGEGLYNEYGYKIGNWIELDQ